MRALLKTLSWAWNGKTGKLLDTDVHEFFKTEDMPRLTPRAHFLAYKLDIKTVRELTNYKARDLLKVESVGQLTIDYIRYMLGKHGLKLAGDL